MDISTKTMLCNDFFNKLSKLLSKTYEVVGSCNVDSSRYLVPNGTSDEITYSSKPQASFRVSDHWNWYSNLKKCPNEHYIQCLSVDAPWPKKRKGKGLASNPIFCSQVAFVGEDGKYHVVYGEKFDRKTKTWSWVDADPGEVIIEHVLASLIDEEKAYEVYCRSLTNERKVEE